MSSNIYFTVTTLSCSFSSIFTLSTPPSSTTLYTLVPDFTTYTKAKAETWANQNGFTIIWDEVQVSNKSQDGKITKQSYHRKKRVDLCNPKTITLTINVYKNSEPVETTDDNTNENDNNEP